MIGGLFRQPACASGQAAKLSAKRVLQHLLVEAEIGDDFPQLGIFVLKLLEPPHLRWQKAVILRFLSFSN
jgi:hypothetical protein